MNSRERVQKALNHEVTDRVPIDLGATVVSSIHVGAYIKLRDRLGLEKKLVRTSDPLLLTTDVDMDVLEALEIDCIGINSLYNSIGVKNENYKEWKMPQGITIGVPGDFRVSYDSDGSVLAYAEGDMSYPPSARMPSSSMYFDCIVRQENLEEKTQWDVKKDYGGQFKLFTEEELKRLESITADYYRNTALSLIGTYFNGGLGDAFHIPAPGMKEAPGIRNIEDWFMGLHLYSDYLSDQFAQQTEISLANLKSYYQAVGNQIDVMVISGADYAHQSGLLVGKDMWRELFMPYYQKINKWVHENTDWKTFMHCCGSAVQLLPEIIESGFDILNPVQVSAKGMDPAVLKEKYGRDIVFWGGGCDPQYSMLHKNPEEVYRETKANAAIFSQNGGFIGGNVHNVQYDVPPENLLAELQALKDTVPQVK